MSYKVQRNGETFDLFETSSNVLIELKTSEQHAKDVGRKMNLGAGFAGWTPEFAAVKYPLTFS